MPVLAFAIVESARNRRVRSIDKVHYASEAVCYPMLTPQSAANATRRQCILRVEQPARRLSPEDSLQSQADAKL